MCRNDNWETEVSERQANSKPMNQGGQPECECANTRSLTRIEWGKWYINLQSFESSFWKCGFLWVHWLRPVVFRNIETVSCLVGNTGFWHLHQKDAKRRTSNGSPLPHFFPVKVSIRVMERKSCKQQVAFRPFSSRWKWTGDLDAVCL